VKNFFVIAFLLSLSSGSYAEQKEDAEMKSFNGQSFPNGTRAEACGAAKQEAEF